MTYRQEWHKDIITKFIQNTKHNIWHVVSTKKDNYSNNKMIINFNSLHKHFKSFLLFL